MSTTKCVCAVMLTEKERVLPRARARRAECRAASAEGFGAWAAELKHL